MENLDLAQVCRICLTKHKDMYLASDVGVAEKLLECASVQLPPESLICEFCKCEVNKWFSFKQQVIKSMEVAKYIEDYHKRREKPIMENYTLIEEYFVKVEAEDEVEPVEIKSEIIEIEDSLDAEQVDTVIKKDKVEVDTSILPEIIYKCDICEKMLKSASALFYHRKAHTKHFQLKSSPPPEENFSNSTLPHSQSEPENKTEDDKKYQCDLCHKSFISKNGIMWHKQIHSALKLDLSKDTERFPCPCCPMVYEKKSSLVDHMQWKHNRSYKKPKFNYSRPKYDCKINLRSHKNEKQKPYKCDNCKKSFMKSSTWRAHRKTQCKDTIFVCNDCGRGFKRQRDLLNHQVKHMDERHNTSTISVEEKITSC